MSDQVDIVHAESGGAATVSERQYADVFRGRGWRLADGSDTETDPADEGAEDADEEPTSQPETGRAKPRSKPRSA